jgi:hypothetical protein
MFNRQMTPKEFNMTPAQKAHETRVFAFARQVVAEINQLISSGGCSDAEVVAIFTGGEKRKAVKADAFFLLDTQPSRFGGSYCPAWFSALRSCRNHPVHGAELFASWN